MSSYLFHVRKQALRRVILRKYATRIYCAHGKHIQFYIATLHTCLYAFWIELDPWHSFVHHFFSKCKIAIMTSLLFSNVSSCSIRISFFFLTISKHIFCFVWLLCLAFFILFHFHMTNGTTTYKCCVFTNVIVCSYLLI